MKYRNGTAKQGKWTLRVAVVVGRPSARIFRRDIAEVAWLGISRALSGRLGRIAPVDWSEDRAHRPRMPELL